MEHENQLLNIIVVQYIIKSVISPKALYEIPNIVQQYCNTGGRMPPIKSYHYQAQVANKYQYFQGKKSFC